MTTLGDDLRDIAILVDALGSSGSGGGAPPYSPPTALNHIPGPAASVPPISFPGLDADGGVEVDEYAMRRCDTMPDGFGMIIGHSQVQGAPVGLVSPHPMISLGRGGESMRRLLMRINQPRYVAALQRAGFVILLTGACDFANSSPTPGAYYTDPLTNPSGGVAAAATVVGMYSRLKAQISTGGKWVLVTPLRCDQRVAGMPAGYNSSADYVGTGMVATFSGMSNVRVVNPNPALIDGTGNLAAANHTDGQHLSKAGNAILYSRTGLIAAAMADLGL